MKAANSNAAPDGLPLSFVPDFTQATVHAIFIAAIYDGVARAALMTFRGPLGLGGDDGIDPLFEPF